MKESIKKTVLMLLCIISSIIFVKTGEFIVGEKYELLFNGSLFVVSIIALLIINYKRDK